MVEALKNSKVAWLGEIPENWSVDRVKFHYKNLKQVAGIKSEDYERLALTLSGVIKRPKDDAEGLQPGDFNGYQVLRTGDLVFKLIDLQNVSTSRVGLAHNTGIVSPAYIRLEPNKNESSRYGEYYFLSMWQREVFNQLGDAGVRSNLSSSDLLELPYISLPLDEQERIADFLDEKCAEIDRLSEDIQKQIDILNDYKKSVITRAVTKGLDPNAEMKESGIEYLGKYPVNWKLSRVKFNLNEPMKYGATESGVEYSEELPRYIRITDITSDNRLKNDGKLSLTWQQAQAYILSNDTILFARSGGTVGKTFYYKPSYGKAAFAGYLISAIPNEKKMLTEWLYFYTLSNTYWEWANQIFTQATIQNIGADKYSNLPITVPDIETQKTIILYLTNKCSEIDDSITLKRSQLDKLATYKKSIIYEYITGKKRVS